jgi:4-amino-4-deoxy-L-arabinose transferase-like glycosyltransferase
VPEITRTPGYPGFLAVLLLLTKHDLSATLFCQVLILAFGPVIIYALARSLMPAHTAFIAGLLLACSPWSSAYSAFPLSDGLYFFCLGVMFFALRRSSETSWPWQAIVWVSYAGLVGAVLTLVKPLVGVLPMTAMSWGVAAGWRRGRTWVCATLFLAAAFVPLECWRQRNMKVAGFDGLSDIGGKAAWWYLASRVRASVIGGDQFSLKNEAMQRDRESGLPLAKANEERWKRACEIFYSHPVLVARCFALSVVEHFAHPSPDILRTSGHGFSGDVIILSLLWTCFVALAILGWIVAHFRRRESGNPATTYLDHILFLCLVLLLASGVSFGGGCRLRLPMEMPLSLYGAIGISYLLHLDPNARKLAD